MHKKNKEREWLRPQGVLSHLRTYDTALISRPNGKGRSLGFFLFRNTKSFIGSTLKKSTRFSYRGEG